MNWLIRVEERVRPLALAAMVTSTVVVPANGQNFLWDGSCGTVNWNSCCPIGGGMFENNWDAGGGAACPPLPGVTDDVDLLGADVLLSQAPTPVINSLTSAGTFSIGGMQIFITQGAVLNELNLGGGGLHAGGPVVVTGPFTWIAGELGHLGDPGDPPVVTQFLDGLTLSGSSGKNLSGRQTICTKDVTWSGGAFNLNEGTSFDSRGTFAVECDETIGNGAPAATFINAGNFVKRMTTGTTLFTQRVEFQSPGPVEIQTGTLRLENAGGFASNVFTVAADARLEFAQFAAGTFTLDVGTALEGTGKVRSTSSALIIPLDATVTANNFELAGGNLRGPGVLNVQDMLWNNGALDDVLVQPMATLALSGFLTKSINNGGEVRNHGQAEWRDTGTLAINKGLFRNRGTFTANSNVANQELRCNMNDADARFQNDGGATFSAIGHHVRFTGNAGTVVNDGTLETSAGTLEFELPFENHGALRMPSSDGLLRIERGGRSTGTFETTGPFGRVLFVGTPYTLDAGTEFTGGGFVEIFGSGKVAVPAGATVPVECIFQLNGGTVSGEGNLFLNNTIGVSSWFGGTMDGAGTTTVGADTQFFITDGASPATKTMSERVLDLNAFNVVFSGAGDLILNNGAQLNVLSNALLNVNGTSGPQDISHNGGDPGEVTIDGELEVNNALRVDANTRFNHHGSANLFSELRLSGGGDFTGGLFAGSAPLELRTRTFDLSNTDCLGALLRINSGTVNVLGGSRAATVEFIAGAIDGSANLTILDALTWSGGAMRGPGLTTVEGTATLAGSNLFLSERALVNAGSGLTWSQGTLTAAEGAGVNNVAPFLITGPVSLSSGTGGGTVDNFDTFAKTDGTGQANIFTPFNHGGGEVRCDVGTLRFAGPFIQTAGVTRYGAGTLVFSQSLTLNGGVVRGAGAATGNIVNNGGTVKPGDSAGQLTQTGDYVQAMGGALEVELGGLLPGTEHDELVVTGSATLDGRLDILLINEFKPQVGDRFTILTCAARTGEFAIVNEPPGVKFIVEYNADNVTLEVDFAGLKGDLNCDGEIDFGDINPFVVALSNPQGYQQQFPDCDINNADINEDGKVDFGDINPFVDLLTHL